MRNSMSNEDKNDPSTVASYEDTAVDNTSDADSPNEADANNTSDADSPSGVGTSSASNSTPNSVSNSAPDSTPESALDNTPDADSSTPQHPHRKRNITIGVIIAVVIVAAIVCILAFAHPWDAADNNDTAPNESGSSHQETQQQQKQEDSSNESLGENKSGDGKENNPNSAGNESNLEDEDVSEGVSNNANNVQDNNSTNQSDSSDGIINRDDYDTEEEYMAAWIAAGAPETQIEKETVPTTKNGSEGYYKGILIVHFYYDLCDEDRAREIVSDFGGILISTTYGRGSSTSFGDFDVEAYFPDAPYKDELKAISEKLSAMPEVSSAYMDSYCSLD